MTTETKQRIADALENAAEYAEKKPSVDKALRVAYSALHIDRDVMGHSFWAWCKHERAGHPQEIGAVLRKRLASAAAVADSLRAAAKATGEQP